MRVTLAFRSSTRILQTGKNRRVDVKMKYKVLGNSQHSICKGKSCFIMQHVFFEGVYDHVDKEDPFIYSTEFLLGFPK